LPIRPLVERRRIWRFGPEDSWKAILPVAFIIASLLALVLLPIVVGTHTSRMRAEITNDAEPARRAANQIQLDLSTELDKVIAFQVTGQPQFRDDYIQLLEQQVRDYDVLRHIGPRLGGEVETDLQALISDTQRWHASVTSGEFLQRQLPTEIFMTRLFERHPAYDRALGTGSTLEGAIQDVAADRLAKIHDAERINTALAILLSFLALVSALLVAQLGRQMRLLAREATRRRQEAEREAGDAKVARAAAEAEERRVAFLANAAQELTASLDFRRAVSTLARLVVPNLAEACVIDFREPDGTLHRRAAAHRDEEEERGLRKRIDQPVADVPEFIARVIRDEEPHVSGPSAELTAFLGLDGEPRSVMAVPLVSRGEVLGVIAAAAAQGLTFEEADALFAAELARNGSLAIDNARLYFDSQQAVRSREEVLAVVSHDLRNPLNAVSLAASLLRSSDTISAEEREQLEIMAVSVERMRRLVEDLLDVTRLEGGKRLPLERSRLDAEALLRETYELFKVQTEAAGIELRHEVPRNLPQLWGDRHRILQVLSNLVGNAMKFTPAGGSITIRAAQHGGMLQLSVSDTGSGIPQEHLKDIFNTYWQAKRTERLGAGLGLPIAKGVVEAHGGRIWVESNPERGATFHFTIPVAVGVKAERREESPAHH